MVTTSQLVQAQGISISVTPAFAPSGKPAEDGSFSPSWPGYVVNATNALRAGAPIVGDRDLDPAAYQAIGRPISPLEMIYTEYNSWRASADPFPTWTDLPAAFAQEQGNRIHFGLQLTSDGTSDFALHDLSWSLDSNDDTDYFDQAANFANANYSSTRIGVNYGPDGVPGGGDDIVYDSGQDGSTKIHALTYVGIGDGFLSKEPAPPRTMTTLTLPCVPCSSHASAVPLIWLRLTRLRIPTAVRL